MSAHRRLVGWGSRRRSVVGGRPNIRAAVGDGRFARPSAIRRWDRGGGKAARQLQGSASTGPPPAPGALTLAVLWSSWKMAAPTYM